MTKDCFDCDCYDPDMGCTMPSIDLSYACPLSSDDDDDWQNMKEGVGNG